MSLCSDKFEFHKIRYRLPIFLFFVLAYFFLCYINFGAKCWRSLPTILGYGDETTKLSNVEKNCLFFFKLLIFFRFVKKVVEELRYEKVFIEKDFFTLWMRPSIQESWVSPKKLLLILLHNSVSTVGQQRQIYSFS